MRKGIDFVPLDVAMDEKFELIEAEFGIKAFAVVVKIFQKIYGVHGYYCEWNKDVELMFARRNGISAGAVSEIVKASVRRNIFDGGMYKNYGILTSHGIQKRYLNANTRKVKVELSQKFLLLSDTELTKNVTILGKIAAKADENDTDNDRNKDNVIKTDVNEHNQNKEPSVVVPQQVIKAYEDNIGKLTAVVKKEIGEKLEDFSDTVIIWAIEEAARQNKPKWKYVLGILKRYDKPSIFNETSVDYDEVEEIIREKMMQ